MMGMVASLYMLCWMCDACMYDTQLSVDNADPATGCLPVERGDMMCIVCADSILLRARCMCKCQLV